MLNLYCGRGKICPPCAMNAVLFALDCKYFIAFNTHLPIKIFSSYFVDLLVLMGVALSTILLISSGETSSNRDIFFTDDAAKNFFPTSKISAQEIRHQFFLIWSGKLNDNGSYHGLREPIRKLENHYPELKIY